MTKNVFETARKFITVTPEKVIIRSKKKRGRTIEYRIDTIVGVEITEPNLIGGYIKLLTTADSGTQQMFNVAELTTFAIKKKHYEDILRCKELIEEYIAKSKSNYGAAEEIKKFAELRDQGIITEDEFAKKKQQLLGI